MMGLLHCGFVPISVTIKDTSGTGRAVATITLDGIDDRISLRDLVRTRVRDEVARYNAAQGEYFAGLVMPVPRPVDWAQQAKRALDAFSRNGFFVLVGDRQVTDLDEELRLTADSDIRFIRLVQLAGG